MTEPTTRGTAPPQHEPDPRTLEAAVKTNNEYRTGQDDQDSRLKKRNAALLIAWDDGWKITTIARHFDLTHGRISQLIAKLTAEIHKDHDKGLSNAYISADREIPVDLVTRLIAAKPNGSTKTGAPK